MKKTIYSIIGLVASIILLCVVVGMHISYETGDWFDDFFGIGNNTDNDDDDDDDDIDNGLNNGNQGNGNSSEDEFDIDDYVIDYQYIAGNGETVKSAIIRKYKGMDKNIELPSTVNGYPLMAIDDSAFAYNTYLESITIPDSVIYVGEYAFYQVRKLSEVSLGSGITEIERSVFSQCTALTKVTLPQSITEINDYAFRNCTSLTDIELPDGVSEIGDYAFSGCSGLTEIFIPLSVEKIGMRAFDDCDKLFIKVQAVSRPMEWDRSWNPDARPVEWGAKR